MALPEQTLPGVEPRPVDSNPIEMKAGQAAAALGQIGQGLQSGAQTAFQIATTERHNAAQFAASDAELKYGTTLDQQVADFKQLGGLAPVQQIGDYEAKLNETREQLRSTLKDPLAQKQYEIRTRIQTQAAMRHMLNHADEQVDKWQADTVDGKISQAVKASGTLVTGQVAGDLKMVAKQAATAVPDLVTLLRSRGVAQEMIDAKVAKVEADMADSALSGYVELDQSAGGLAFLNSKFPGTDTDVRAVLGAKAAADWERKFTDRTKAKEQNDLAGRWYFGGLNPKQAARDYIAKGGDYGIAAEALLKYETLKTRDYQEGQRIKAEAINGAYNLVASKFGGDVDRAVEAGVLSKLEPVQLAQVRQMLDKTGRYDPEAERGRAQFGDLMNAGPGWSDNYPSEDSFMGEWGPRVGPHHLPELRAAFEADHRRPKEQDKFLSRELSLLDDSARRLLKYPHTFDNPDSAYWSNAQPWQVNLREWMNEQFKIGVEQHAAQVKAGKTTDPNWASKLREQVIEGAREEARQEKRGHVPGPLFQAPGTPGVPPGVRTYLSIPRGSKLYSDGQWYAPGEKVPAGLREIKGGKMTPGQAQRFPPGPPPVAGSEPPEDLDTPEGQAWLESPAGKAWTEQGAE